MDPDPQETGSQGIVNAINRLRRLIHFALVVILGAGAYASNGHNDRITESCLVAAFLFAVLALGSGIAAFVREEMRAARKRRE